MTHTFTRRSALLGMVGALAELSGCGGGGGSGLAGLSSGGTDSFTSGTITGFGSIIVNGIRYNNDNASVLNDDVSSTNSALQLGMVVNIEGSTVTPAANANTLPTGTATRITFGSEWQGPVSNIQATSFDVLGNTVDVLTSTIFSGTVTLFSNLATTHFVEVHGYVNKTTGRLQATRVEVNTTAPTAYKISGPLSQFAPGGNTATVGQTNITWSAPVAMPSGVSSGALLRVVLSPTTPNNNVWTATRISAVASPLARLDANRDVEGEVHGIITSYSSIASFVVNAVPVDASNAQITGTLALNARVEIEGTIRQGTLVASKVSVQTNTDIEAKEFEFHGQITQITSNPNTFVIRGQTITYDNTTVGVNLLSATPTVVMEVKAKGVNGVLLATLISNDN
jgi:hypothetical protein